MKVLIPRTVINVSIPYTLRERLAVLSAEQGATLSGTVANILAAYFSERDRRAARNAKKGGRA